MKPWVAREVFGPMFVFSRGRKLSCNGEAWGKVDGGEYVKAVKGWKDEVAIIGSGGSDSGLGES